MEENSIGVFVNAVTHYFSTLGATDAVVGAPFLTNDINNYLLDYTGIIGISGNHKGSVFVSGPERMLKRILNSLGIFEANESRIMDVVGEVTNTISGNARATFGDQFMISVPVVVKGKTENIQVSTVTAIYVIPIVWQSYKANIIISLTEGDEK